MTASHLGKQRRDKVVPMNPECPRAKSCSEMWQAPISKVVVFSLPQAILSESPLGYNLHLRKGRQLHLNTFCLGFLLLPLVAADWTKYEKIQTAFAGRCDGLQDLLRPDSLKSLSPMHGSHIWVAKTPANFFFDFTAHIHNAVQWMLCT